MWTVFRHCEVGGQQKRVKGYGLVAFPVDSPDYYDSNEGGLSVFLLIFPEQQCKPKSPFSYEQCDDRMAVYLHGLGTLVLEDWAQEALFPPPNPSSPYAPILRGRSRPLTACLRLGSTNWSGRHREARAPFRATWEHLTPEGKTLVDALLGVYPLHNFVLVTVLDT